MRRNGSGCASSSRGEDWSAEKQIRPEWAITQLAGLYQPVDTINKTPHPTDNTLEVCEAHQLLQVGSLPMVKGDTNYLTPSKCVKQDPAKTQFAPGPGPSMKQQLKVSATTSLSESVVLDESDDSPLVQAMREEARGWPKTKERKVTEKVLEVAERQRRQIKRWKRQLGMLPGNRRRRIKLQEQLVRIKVGR